MVVVIFYFMFIFIRWSVLYKNIEKCLNLKLEYLDFLFNK